MSDRPHVLLTNDDGINAPGLHALREALIDVCEVTVVAPTENQTGVGRRDTRSFTVEKRSEGYALDGTPCSCVLYGLRGCGKQPDVVVSGCNDSPNIGAFKQSRSGTISAAIEAAYLDTPGIALSCFDRDEVRKLDYDDYAGAGRVARYLVEHTLGNGVFESIDYLSVNVPAVPPDVDELRLTRPITDYDIEVRPGDEDGVFSLYKSFYDPLLSTSDDDVDLDPRTDRGALADGVTSVSPGWVKGDSTIDASSRLASLLAAYPEG